MRVVREVETCFGVGGAPVGIDLERTNFPVGRNRADHEEHQDQAGEEQEESNLATPATVPFITRGHRDVRRSLYTGGYLTAGRVADRRCYQDGFGDGLRRSRDRIGHGRLRLGGFGWDRRARLGWGGTTGQPGQPRVQLCLIGRRSRILRWGATPRDEAHLRPTLAPADYDPYFVCLGVAVDLLQARHGDFTMS